MIVCSPSIMLNHSLTFPRGHRWFHLLILRIIHFRDSCMVHYSFIDRRRLSISSTKSRYLSIFQPHSTNTSFFSTLTSWKQGIATNLLYPITFNVVIGWTLWIAHAKVPEGDQRFSVTCEVRHSSQPITSWANST